MNEITKADIRELLKARHFESYQTYHVRKAIEAAEAADSSKARVDVDVLRDLLPKAHRVSP